jgi:hypothetical protein
MPKALGEFGKAKSADVTHKVIEYVYEAEGIVTMKDIWKQVSQELEKIQDLGTIIQKLLFADKLQAVNGGFLPVRRLIPESELVASGLLDYRQFLTDEELGVKK